MAADVLGRGVDAEVDAVLEGLEVQRRRPGVVEHGENASTARGRGDRGHVLHLEGQRAWRFHVDDPGLGPDQARDLGADQRVVVGRLDAEA